MKKCILFACAFFVTMGMMSCDNDDNGNGQRVEEETPVDTTEWATAEEVAAFFDAETAINAEGMGRPAGFFSEFTEEELTTDDGIFVRVVNSQEELAALYEGQKELPAIDFSTQTFLLGMVQTPFDDDPDGRRQELTEQAGNYDLTLTFVEFTGPDVAHLITFIHHCFWGLYPKLADKPVQVHVKIAEKEIEK